MKACAQSSRSLAGILLGLTLCCPWTVRTRAQGAPQFQQTKLVALQEPVFLEVDIKSGQLQILYSRDGEVSLSVSMQSSSGVQAGGNSFPLFEQNGNHITLRMLGDNHGPKSKTPLYRLDVPYRTEVVSHVGAGTQEISGIMGPVRAVTESGNTRVAYVSQDVTAASDNGSLDFDVIGGRIQARVRRGNISCTRAALGIAAESERGDITLVAVGPSAAKVIRGPGRIEVSGARSTFTGSTDAGDIHVRAVAHDNWQISSRSGNIRIELPSNSSFLLDASTVAGEIVVDREDLESEAVSAASKRIDLHSETGQVAVH